MAVEALEQRVTALEEKLDRAQERIESLAMLITRYGFADPRFVDPALSVLDRLETLERKISNFDDLRNRMNHRSNIPRIGLGAGGAEAPSEQALQFVATSSTAAIEADTPYLEGLFAWLADALRGLLEQGTIFAAHP